MQYLTKQMAVDAIKKMKNFHQSLVELHEEYDLDFFADLGRRNILMSRPQEVFFCDQIKKSFSSANSDGRTGQPDIMVPELNKELECKITTKRKGGSWAFQADYATLERKGSCDFLYVCCDEDFSNFAVYYFDSLTVDNFKPPAPGSRGKSRLLVRTCIDKCYPLVGSLHERNKVFIKNAENKLSEAVTQEQKNKAQKSIDFWNNSEKSYTIVLEEI